MRLPIQIETIIFRRNKDKIEYLLLKRKAEKGGFWQPISGGLRDTESIPLCMNRESKEEIGVDKFIRIVENVHFFQFDEFNTYRKNMKVYISEFVFGAEVSMDTQVNINANPDKEHEEFKWCDFNEAIKLLKWDHNKEALTKLNEILLNE